MPRAKAIDPAEEAVANALRLGCNVTMVAHDEAEADRFRALLKGRHGNALVSVRLCKHPDEFTPIMDLVRRRAARGKPEPAPAVVDDLDYDGY